MIENHFPIPICDINLTNALHSIPLRCISMEGVRPI